MSKTRKILVPIVLILGLIQFIPSKRAIVEVNPVDSFKTDNAEVKSILDKACMDCHSFESKYPWYAHVVPVSTFLDNHINEGREHLNFSEWNTYPTADRNEIIGEIIEVVNEKEMPLLSYWLIHWDAKLTDAERKTLVDYFTTFEGGNFSTGADGAEGEGEGDDD
jgi:hypothetical protein